MSSVVIKFHYLYKNIKFKGNVSFWLVNIFLSIVLIGISVIYQDFWKQFYIWFIQEVNWHFNTQKVTDLTREMRTATLTDDGYQNFTDVMRGLRLAKGKKTYQDYYYPQVK